MPRSEYAGRQVTLYLDTHADLVRWTELARPSTLNRWVIEIVEASIDAPTQKSSNKVYGEEINQLRKENLALKQEVERLAARVNEAEKIHERSTASTQLEKDVVDLLRPGGVWTPSKINENLLIDNKLFAAKLKDMSMTAAPITVMVERAKAINRTLEQLELLGLIKQTSRGWTWNNE
jgi:hypothetical protein